jgi:hypothetical protein
MAKAKRANHRTGSERIDEPAWEVAPVTDGNAANGHTGQNGAPNGQNGRTAAGGNPQYGQNPQGRQYPQKPNAARPPQNGHQTGHQTGQPQNGQPQGGRPQDAPPNGQPAGQSRVTDLGTPVKVDEIAVAALALSENLQAATRGLSESVESRQLRRDLDDAADTFRSVASELETTASNLIRLAANEGQVCGVIWGECPEHGLTLMNAGEKVTCHVLGCHREYEGAIERCTQPVAYRVVDAAGPALLTCAGHAIACRLHFEGAVITLASDSLELL